MKALAGYIEENELNIRLRLIGTSDEEIESPVFPRQEDIQERRSQDLPWSRILICS